jgi:DNA-binding Lrp family transcriptional regulator
MFSKKKNSYEWVVKTTVETLGIKKQEAQKRVNALLKSGILDGLQPNDIWFQMLCENFMRFSSEQEYKQVFEETLNFPDFIREYDIRNKANLGIELHISRLNKSVTDSLTEEVNKFHNFFYESFWNKMRAGYAP